jgi:acyl-CoA thioesterase FadM
MSVTGAPRIRTEVQVMFFDTDCGGVVHNIAYLRFIEIARTLLAEQNWATVSPLKVGSINSNACDFGAPFGSCGTRTTP